MVESLLFLAMVFPSPLDSAARYDSGGKKKRGNGDGFPNSFCLFVCFRLLKDGNISFSQPNVSVNLFFFARALNFLRIKDSFVSFC